MPVEQQVLWSSKIWIMSTKWFLLKPTSCRTSRSIFQTTRMPTKSTEKLAFAQRLALALTRNPKKVSTPTELALQFNLRHQNDPITPQAAQKWLSGKALPTPDKLETLATWLNVSPLWLRHGISESKPLRPSIASPIPKQDGLSPTELLFLEHYRNLPAHRRKLVNEIVEQFALEQEIWRV